MYIACIDLLPCIHQFLSGQFPSGPLPYSVYDLFPECGCFLFDHSRRLFCCLVYPFFFGGILWFLSCCLACLGVFWFLGYCTKSVPFELSPFLEVVFVFDCLAQSFQPFPIV